MISVAQRLRQKLLDLAIHGKLVPQDPKDESASELLARIRKARSAICKARTSVTPLSIPEEEIPFDLPRGWVWCRLGEVCEVLDSKRKPITKCDRKPGPYPYYGATSIQDYVEGYIFDEPLLLLGEDGAKWGPGEASAFLIDGKTWVNNHAHVLRIDECAERGFICYALESLDLMPYITGTTVPKLNQARMCQIVVPLPPLAEQKRIVEKLDGMLNEATRVAEGTERLAQLRKKAKAKILDLAIRGKLVKQEKSDEPASELLKRIATEKAKLVAEKKIKKGKPLPPITDDDKPFELPSGWAWCRLGDIAEIQLGKMLDAEKNTGKPFRYLANVSVRWGSFDVDNLKTTLFTDDEIEKFALKQGDLLMCEGGVPGRCAVWREHDSEIKYQKALHRIRPCEVLPDYLQIYFEAIYQRPFFTERFTGSTIHHLPREVLMSVPVPLPPLAEQRRIVAKVKEMLAACDAFGGEG